MQILRPTLVYACPIWGHAAHSNIKQIDIAQNLILRTITKADWYIRNEDIRSALNLKTLTEKYPCKLVTSNKLKLDDRGCRRQGRLFPEGWEKKVNHDVMMDLIKRSPTTKRGGRTYPKARALYRSRAPAGRGEEHRKESGTAEGSESKAVRYHPRTQSKRRSAVQLNHIVKSVKRVFFVELWGAERVSPLRRRV
ncbi:hypothetical protein TNCV_1373771 [Trichonephila clavipes]|nr:hypothetical protein TNCV_1373771 [Trichonephila clavipes]